MYDPDKPRLTEVGDAERDLVSCMLRLPTPMVICLVTVLVAG